jgi:hypothetical protein
LPAVSKKISWREVKLFAQNNVTRVVGRANRRSARAPDQARLTHFPSFAMQTAGWRQSAPLLVKTQTNIIDAATTSAAPADRIDA